jgi:hypothetical protein
MKIIIDIIVEFKGYIFIAVAAVLGGFAYFFAVYFAKKYITQVKNVRYLYASVVLIIINIFYVIVTIQKISVGTNEFAISAAYLLLSICATLIYTVLAVAVTANQKTTIKIKSSTATKQNQKVKKAK